MFEKLLTHKTVWFSLFGTLNLILLLTSNNRWALAYFIEVLPSSLLRDFSLSYVRPARHLSCDCVAFKKLIEKVIVLLCVHFSLFCVRVVLCVCLYCVSKLVCLQTMLHIHAHIGRERNATYTHTHTLTKHNTNTHTRQNTDRGREMDTQQHYHFFN